MKLIWVFGGIGSATGEDGRGRVQLASTDAPPTVLRGLLTMKLTKPSRIRKIEIRLEGKSRTEWPEGKRVKDRQRTGLVSSSIDLEEEIRADNQPFDC